MAKQSFPKYMSPAGIAVFPSLNKPDTKFKAAGEYKVRLKVTEAEAEKLVAQVASLTDAFYAETEARLKSELAEATDGKKKATLKKALADLKKADPSITDDVDDEGEPNGYKLLNFKMPASYESKKDKDADGNPKRVPMKPAFFNAKGQPIKNPPDIWGGTKMIISGELRPFYTSVGVGVSLRLLAVQILELNSGGTRDFGFGAQEGYEGPDEDDSPASGGDSEGSSTGPAAGADEF